MIGRILLFMFCWPLQEQRQGSEAEAEHAGADVLEARQGFRIVGLSCGPLLDFAGVCAMCPYLVYGI